MKKIAILLFLGVLAGGVVHAQSADVKKDQRVLKNTIKDKKEDNHQVTKDLTHFRMEKAAQHHREVVRHRRSIHKQVAHLEQHGVKDPKDKAKDQLKAEEAAKKRKS